MVALRWWHYSPRKEPISRPRLMSGKLHYQWFMMVAMVYDGRMIELNIYVYICMNEYLYGMCVLICIYNVVTRFESDRILIIAASNGHSEAVALLAEKGANIQAQDNVRKIASSYTYTGIFTIMYTSYIHTYLL